MNAKFVNESNWPASCEINRKHVAVLDIYDWEYRRAHYIIPFTIA